MAVRGAEPYPPQPCLLPRPNIPGGRKVCEEPRLKPLALNYGLIPGTLNSKDPKVQMENKKVTLVCFDCGKIGVSYRFRSVQFSHSVMYNSL